MAAGLRTMARGELDALGGVLNAQAVRRAFLDEFKAQAGRGRRKVGS